MSIYDVIDRRVVFDESVPGRIISGVAWGVDDINLWRSESDGESTLLHLDALAHATVEVGRVVSPKLPHAVAPGIAVTEGDGAVNLTDLDNAYSFPILSVDVGVSQWTALGLSGDSRRLVVTNEPSGAITVVDSMPDQWLESACKTAGRQFSKEEWQALTGRSAMAEQAC